MGVIWFGTNIYSQYTTVNKVVLTLPIPMTILTGQANIFKYSATAWAQTDFTINAITDTTITLYSYQTTNGGGNSTVHCSVICIGKI